MRRREFITMLGGAAAAWPLAARAQQPDRMRRIGVLMAYAESDPEGQARLAAFLQELQQLGWVEGRGVRIDVRWGAGDAERIRRYATELVGLTPDILMGSTTPAVAALQQATATVPIVFAQVGDPVGAGFVDSLARPGGTTTGFSVFEFSFGGKWLELLKEIAPTVTRVAVIRDPAIASGMGQWGAIQSAAPPFGVELRPVNVRDAGEIERAVTSFTRLPDSGLIVTGSPLAYVHRELIIALAVPTACCLLGSGLRRRRRPDLLRARSGRPVSARSRLRRSHPQGREACRPSGAGTDQVRAGSQPQDREDARAGNPDNRARPRRRGDRMRRERRMNRQCKISPCFTIWVLEVPILRA